MSKRMAVTVAVCLSAIVLAGCASRGSFNGQTTNTQVALSQANFRMIQPGARGVSRGFRLLGIIPFGSPSYAKAKSRIYASANEELAGRPVALVNQTEDRSVLYLILFSIPKLTLTADIIEFKDSTPAPAAKPAM